MQVVQTRCCGLDMHQQTVVACLLLTEPHGHVHREVRRTPDHRSVGALRLAGRLAGHRWGHPDRHGVDRSRPESTGVDRSRPESTGVDRSRPESTGVDWRPVFKLLEDESRALVLVNPQHLKAVPGRKTAGKESEGE